MRYVQRLDGSVVGKAWLQSDLKGVDVNPVSCRAIGQILKRSFISEQLFNSDIKLLWSCYRKLEQANGSQAETMELCGLCSGMSGSKGMGLASFDFVRVNGWQCHWDIV